MSRPLKFTSNKKLQQSVDAYFEDCESNGRPLTISGLAIALDTTRQTLIDYETREEFSDTIKKAKLRIENWTEEQLFTSSKTAGIIFNLTNNFGWSNKLKEKQQVNEWPGFAEMMKEADKVLEEYENAHK